MEQTSNQKEAQRTLLMPRQSVCKNNTLPLKNTANSVRGNPRSENGTSNELVESASDHQPATNIHSQTKDGQSLQTNVTRKQSDHLNRMVLPLIPQQTAPNAKEADCDNSSLDDMHDEDEVNDVMNNGTKKSQNIVKNNGQGGWSDLTQLDSLPLMKSGYSLEADMKFGWKPQVKGKILPIPFVFDSEDHLFNLTHYTDKLCKTQQPVIYQGFRPADSFKLYKKILSLNDPYHGSSFKFKVPNELPPAIQKLIDQQMQAQVLGGTRSSVQKDRFEGMNSEHKQLYESGSILQFDAMFESGNLDRVVMVSPLEYDLYMRPDTNTRGHHQWFFFQAIAKKNLGAVRFNIINFTKQNSLYDQGMKVCICSCQEKTQAIDSAKKTNTKNFDAESLGWKKGGYDIIYQRSKLNEIIERVSERNSEFAQDGGVTKYRPLFYQMSFSYDFNYMEGDRVYFAHSFPYTFTKLTKYLEQLKMNPEVMSYTKDPGPICHSLSGIDIPYLIVTSRVNEENYKMIVPEEHSHESLPEDKVKRTVVITSRVHPGETNASYMAEGFINFITNPKDPMAQELRKRIVFKIVPCINPDGVMAGNYRVSMSGNDLNRKYLNPHQKLHPIVCAVKKMIKEDENTVMAFIDMHGHSRKKNVFMYGPEFPIHDNRYVQMRIIPKIMSELTPMFRYYSCKFRIQASKEKTARVVLWKEFNIMNCFTIEASLHGFFDETRDTTDFLMAHSIKVGKMLGKSIFEYMIMKEDDEKAIKARREEAKKQKLRIQQQLKKSKASDTKELSTFKAVLSPSGSSEALNNIDDQQPNEKSKLNQIRKKLLKAQSVEKNSKGQILSNQKDKKNNDKKFKLTKKFKDDIQQSSVKKRESLSNPMEATDETEYLPNPNEDEQADQADFVAQYKLNKRTMKDLCNQIETEEKDLDKQNSQDEGNVSDQQQNLTNYNNKIDDSGSEEDVLLQEIQGNILGIIDKSDQAPPVINEKKKAKKPQDSSSKKPPKTAQTNSTSQRPKESSVNQGNKQKDNMKSQKTQDDKKTNEKKKQINGIQIVSTKPRAERKGSGQGLQRRESSNALIHRRELLQPHVDPKIQLAPAQSQIVKHIQQQNQGQQQLQMNYNNFNDRIINQSYHKHKKVGPQIGAGYHLTTLSANAQQLLQHQLMQEKAKREKMLESHKSTQKNSVDHNQKGYAMYNFQARNNNKNEPQIENNVFTMKQREINQSNDQRYKLTSKQFNTRTNIDSENIDQINHQRENKTYRRDQYLTRGPAGFMVTNSQEKQFQQSQLEKVQSNLNINRTSQQFISHGPVQNQKEQPDQQMNNDQAPFKKRNRRIVEQQIQEHKVIEISNKSQQRLVMIQPNQISHHASYQQVMLHNQQQESNNSKQYYTQQNQQKQFQSKEMNLAMSMKEHGGDLVMQRMSDTPIQVPQENRSEMKVDSDFQGPSSAGPFIENGVNHRSSNKYKLVIEKDLISKQGRISIVTQKMTDALSKGNGQSRTAPMASQLMSFSISTQKDQESFYKKHQDNEPQVYESASKNRSQFHQFYPNLNNQVGANEAYGLKQMNISPKGNNKLQQLQNIQKSNDDHLCSTFATPLKQQLGPPSNIGRVNNLVARNDNLTTGSKLALPCMTNTSQDVAKFQLPNENELKRVQEQQLYNYIDLRTPQQNTKSDSGGYNKKKLVPSRQQQQLLQKQENKEYLHQFGERSVPNFDQIADIQMIRNGDSHQLPLTMKGSVTHQSQTAQKPARNPNLIAPKDPTMFNTRQSNNNDNKFSRKEIKSESKVSVQNQSKQRINTSGRNNQNLGKPYEGGQRMKQEQEIVDGLQDHNFISKGQSHQQSDFDHRQRNLDQKCFQYIKATSKKADFNSALAQKEMQKQIQMEMQQNLHTMDHRRVNYIKNQIKNQQDQYNNQTNFNPHSIQQQAFESHQQQQKQKIQTFEKVEKQDKNIQL